ncbi:hypothetical protein PIB30_081639 [Stylosanthes scabra]|uniref:Uncharacterized protein n=1 Tax=Stylosanthes scabra TaxID=79078 RepID=A0ABU6SS85_9FABA|nr:hypothetical protein [Stylosanthes scabra]
MEISYSDSTTKKFYPLADKLYEDNYITWKHLTLFSVESLGMEDHLDSSKMSPRFFEDQAKKTTTKNEEYKTWKQQDLTLTTWLVASLETTRSYSHYLASIGYEVQDYDHLHAIIDGLFEDYAMYIHDIVTRMGSIRVPEAESNLLAFEDMIGRFKNPTLTIPVAHLAQTNSNNRGNSRGRYRGGQNSNRGGGRFNYNTPRPQCQLCGRTGHVV